MKYTAVSACFCSCSLHLDQFRSTSFLTAIKCARLAEIIPCTLVSGFVDYVSIDYLLWTDKVLKNSKKKKSLLSYFYTFSTNQRLCTTKSSDTNSQINQCIYEVTIDPLWKCNANVLLLRWCLWILKNGHFISLHSFIRISISCGHSHSYSSLSSTKTLCSIHYGAWLQLSFSMITIKRKHSD